MNWDAIGAVGEIIGAAAVVASLVYLSIQIRHNSKIAEAASLKDVIDGFTDRILLLGLNTPELFEVFFEGSKDFDSLSDSNQRIFFQILSLYILHGNNVLQQYEKGLISQEDYYAWLRYIASMLKTDGGSKLWIQAQKTTAPSIVNALNEYIANNPNLPSMWETWDYWNNKEESN